MSGPVIAYSDNGHHGRVGGAIGLSFVHLNAGWFWCVAWRNHITDLGQFMSKADAEARAVAAIEADPDKARHLVEEWNALDRRQGGWRAAHLPLPLSDRSGQVLIAEVAK